MPLYTLLVPAALAGVMAWRMWGRLGANGYLLGPRWITAPVFLLAGAAFVASGFLVFGELAPGWGGSGSTYNRNRGTGGFFFILCGGGAAMFAYGIACLGPRAKPRSPRWSDHE